MKMGMMCVDSKSEACFCNDSMKHVIKRLMPIADFLQNAREISLHRSLCLATSDGKAFIN